MDRYYAEHAPRVELIRETISKASKETPPVCLAVYRLTRDKVSNLTLRQYVTGVISVGELTTHLAGNGKPKPARKKPANKSPRPTDRVNTRTQQRRWWMAYH